MTSLPAVDVVIPAYNAGRTIRDAVQSCLDQTASRLRVIVVDDGSTDDTAARVAALALLDHRVTLIRQGNAGIAAAMNCGIRAGVAGFVARLDADDLAHPDRHARQLIYLLDHPDVVALSGAHREIAGDGRDTGRVHRPPVDPVSNPDRIPAQEPELTQPFTMFRRSALEAVGLFRAFPVSEDTDLSFRLMAQGRLANLGDVVGQYRMHGASISGGTIRNGRRMALCSQLAALSAQRRARNGPDVDPGKDGLHRLLSAPEDMEQTVEVIATRVGMDARERHWFMAAAAAKLMELAGYRPYELDEADCAFIARVLRADHLQGLAHDPADMARRKAATAARLFRSARLADAARLAQGSWAPVLARAATKRLYWSKRPG